MDVVSEGGAPAKSAGRIHAATVEETMKEHISRSYLHGTHGAIAPIAILPDHPAAATRWLRFQIGDMIRAELAKISPSRRRDAALGCHDALQLF